MIEALRRRMVRENRIYIMPSGRGFLFLASVVVLIMTAATYNNNMIFILAFFMFSVFVVSMLQTHYMLKGVRLDFVGSDEAFEGDRMTLLFHITQKRARLKQGLVIRTLSRRFATLKSERETLRPGETNHPARIEVAAWKRGVHAVPEVALETYFPLGMFRAWKIFRPKGKLVVYPKPEGARVLNPAPFEQGEDEAGLGTSPDGDFGELKRYQPGESYHQIAWKHYARTGALLTKVHWGEDHKHYVIGWNPTASDLEAYLRQMSRWVQQAVDEGASFELETPAEKLEPGRGVEHARRGWRALAAFKGAS